MNDIEHKDLAFELKVTGEGQGRRLIGYGACVNNVDSVGDIIAPGAFKSDLESFLAKGVVAGLNHDWGNPIAKIQTAHEDAMGLYFESFPIKRTTHGNDVLELCCEPNPVITKMSIGFRVPPGGSRYIDNPAEVKALWDRHSYMPSEQDMQRAEKGVRLLERIKVLEVSPVTIPANDRASMSLVKSAASAGFTDHSRKVASAVGESLEEVGTFLKRCESRSEARFKEGRELSQANWQGLKDVHDQHMDLCEKHKAMCDRMSELLDRTKPKAKGETVPEPEPFKVDEAAILAQYAVTMFATDPAFN